MGQCSTYPICSLTKAKPTLQVTQDHSLGAFDFGLRLTLFKLTKVEDVNGVNRLATKGEKYD